VPVPAEIATGETQLPFAHSAEQAPLETACHCPSVPQYCGVLFEHCVGVGFGAQATHAPPRQTGADGLLHGAQALPPLPQLVGPSEAVASHVVALLQHPAQPLVVSQTQLPPEKWVPLPAAQGVPQVPQLPLSDWRSTQAPPQRLYPLLQAKVHWLAEHFGIACVTVVVHALLQVLQLFGSVVVSTQLEPQRVGVGAEQPDTQLYVAPEPEQSGVAPMHAFPQAPQFDVCEMSVSHPLSGSFEQGA
jgi:hypothetical protein